MVNTEREPIMESGSRGTGPGEEVKGKVHLKLKAI